MRSNSAPRSVISRVKRSSRPVELLALATAARPSGSASALDAAGPRTRSPSPAPRRRQGRSRAWRSRRGARRAAPRPAGRTHARGRRRRRASNRGSPAAPGRRRRARLAVMAPAACSRDMPCAATTPAAPRASAAESGEMVGLARFELTTFRPPVERATRLRYSPTGGALSSAPAEGKGGKPAQGLRTPGCGLAAPLVSEASAIVGAPLRSGVVLPARDRAVRAVRAQPHTPLPPSPQHGARGNLPDRVVGKKERRRERAPSAVAPGSGAGRVSPWSCRS